MKNVLVPVALMVLVVAGCNTQKSPPEGKDGKKFTLSTPKDVEIDQNGEQKVTVSIERKNFDEPVTVTVDKLPEGVVLLDKEPKIEKGKKEVILKLKAGEKAKPGKNTMTVMASGGGVSDSRSITIEIRKATGHTSLHSPVAAEEKLKKDREKLSADIGKTMKDIDADMKDLQARAKTATGKAKEEMDKEVSRLEKQRQELSKQYEHVQHATAQEWNDFSTRLSGAAQDLAAGVRKAVDRFKK